MKVHLYRETMDKLQGHWEDFEAVLTERHSVGRGIRSSQIGALVSLLVELGVINESNISLIPDVKPTVGEG